MFEEHRVPFGAMPLHVCPAGQLEHCVVQRPPWQTVHAGQSASAWHLGTHVVVVAPGSTLHARGEAHVTAAHAAGGIAAASTRRLAPLDAPELEDTVPPELAEPPPGPAPLDEESPLDDVAPPRIPLDELPPGVASVQLPSACSWPSSAAQSSALPAPTTSRHRVDDAPVSVGQHAERARHPVVASSAPASPEMDCATPPPQAPRAARVQAASPPYRTGVVLARRPDPGVACAENGRRPGTKNARAVHYSEPVPFREGGEL